MSSTHGPGGPEWERDSAGQPVWPQGDDQSAAGGWSGSAGPGDGPPLPGPPPPPAYGAPGAGQPPSPPYGLPAAGQPPSPGQLPSPAPGYGPVYPSQGYPPGQVQPQGPWSRPGFGAPPPQNYLVWAILTTVLCCMPLGIVSIVYAAQVNSKWMSGDAHGAYESSNNAKKFAIWSAGVWGVFVGGYILLMVLGVLGSALSY